jgi:hypothetical protein
MGSPMHFELALADHQVFAVEGQITPVGEDIEPVAVLDHRVPKTIPLLRTQAALAVPDHQGGTGAVGFAVGRAFGHPAGWRSVGVGTSPVGAHQGVELFSGPPFGVLLPRWRGEALAADPGRIILDGHWQIVVP